MIREQKKKKIKIKIILIWNIKRRLSHVTQFKIIYTEGSQSHCR
jgi:hypothetical protein